MKKFISVALVLVMMFAVAVSAAAVEYSSPTAENYYSITTKSEGKGSASSDKNKVNVDAVGEDSYVTLTAVEEGGFFTKWIMDGSYNVISGDEYSYVFVIQPTSDILAIAHFTEEEEFLNFTVDVIGDGTASADPIKVKKGSGDTVTLTAVDGKDTFVDWTLECEYEIISGDLKSRTLVIKPLTDIHAIAKFAGEGATEAVTPTQKPASGGGTSPKTADPTMMILALILLAMGAGVFAVKRIKD